MADTSLINKYFFKKEANDDWQDFSTAYKGVRVLRIEGLGELGDAVNVYSEQWMESQEEDFLITGSSGKIIRKNVDLSMTIIISRRYIDDSLIDFYDEMEMYNTLVDELLSEDFYIHSEYTKLQAHVVCNKGFKPTTMDFQRGRKSYILVTIPLHCLDKPKEANHPCSCALQDTQE